jgi:hypothetical protein
MVRASAAEVTSLQSGQHDRSGSAVQLGHDGEPTAMPPLIWATIRGPPGRELS